MRRSRVPGTKLDDEGEGEKWKGRKPERMEPESKGLSAPAVAVQENQEPHPIHAPAPQCPLLGVLGQGTSGPGSNFHLVNRRGFATALPTGQVTDTCFSRSTIVARPAYGCSLQVPFTWFLHAHRPSLFFSPAAGILGDCYAVQRTVRVPVAEYLPRNLPVPTLPDGELSNYSVQTPRITLATLHAQTPHTWPGGLGSTPSSMKLMITGSIVSADLLLASLVFQLLSRNVVGRPSTRCREPTERAWHQTDRTTGGRESACTPINTSLPGTRHDAYLLPTHRSLAWLFRLQVLRDTAEKAAFSFVPSPAIPSAVQRSWNDLDNHLCSGTGIPRPWLPTFCPGKTTNIRTGRQGASQSSANEGIETTPSQTTNGDALGITYFSFGQLLTRDESPRSQVRPYSAINSLAPHTSAYFVTPGAREAPELGIIWVALHTGYATQMWLNHPNRHKIDKADMTNDAAEHFLRQPKSHPTFRTFDPTITHCRTMRSLA
ncbi:uncharacterized protein CLUP02_06125 [Colletotrichum lupini]|uniref:Uncharacterized protein n=1 Tax=Colletotrichum lupini TaxID=145971 RepID=A0A9Q8SNJ4_9PEZI|nr:uncharacterized protein CLUP02_06125 [Colletotrichum lupini]UQC80641.1 hypothetical protein CLUP02_06125 [Colletotrichum lupini]